MAKQKSSSIAIVRRGAQLKEHKAVKTQKWKSYIWSYIYLAPMFGLLVIFMIYPMIMSFKYIFYDWNGIGNPTDFVGWKNVFLIAQDGFFWHAFLNTIIYTVTLVPIQLFFALVLAIVLNNPNLKGAVAYRTVYFLPVLSSAAIVAMVWSLINNAFGASISKMLGSMQTIDFLGDYRYNFFVIILFGIWIYFGYNLVYFLAALQSVPKDLYEAAKVDGAGPMAQFIHITVPVLKPVGTVILFMAIIGSLRVFDPVWVMTEGGPYYATEVLNTYIYKKAFSAVEDVNIGMASAAAMFTSLVIFVLAMVQVFFVAKVGKSRSENKIN